MKNGKWLFRMLFWGGALILAACVTVNIYFPAAEVQKAADQIVNEVRPDLEGTPPANTKDKPQSRLLLPLLKRVADFWVSPAYAQVDIDISSPAIRNLRSRLAARFPKLQPFYENKVIGENRKGYLEMRNPSGVDLKQRAMASKLIQEENNDRAALYEEIVRANNLERQAVPQVEKLFANSWRTKAAGLGWLVQDDNGVWSK